MPAYWLDSNVFIGPKDTYYDPAIAPGYWDLLDQGQARGMAVPYAVYIEITKKPDALAAWAKAREKSGLFVIPDRLVQAANSDVANHVVSAYPPQLVSDFLKGADPFVIAHAKAKGGVVVTFESRNGNGIYKIKIPSVCDHFHIQTVSVFQMMRSLGVKLKL